VPTARLRLGTSIIAGLLVASIAGSTSAAVLDPFDAATLALARADLASLLNAQRVANGLVSLQLDPSATAIAQERAETLAATDLVSHVAPDGHTVFDAISAAGLSWFGAAEVLAWNTYPTEPDSTAQSVSAWLASAEHRSIVLSSDYNYIGFGAAVSPATGKRYYVGVVLKELDKTGGWTKASYALVQGYDATRVRITVAWTGADTRLQVLTAGLRDFEIQRRASGSAWQSLAITTHTSLTVTVWRGVVNEFRVRARDNAGNRGAWSSIFVTT
jgi:uncharacterized protein YkwD